MNSLMPVKYHKLGGMNSRTYPQAMPPMMVLDTSSSQIKIMYGVTLRVRRQWARLWSEARKAPKAVRPREMPHVTEATDSSLLLGALSTYHGGIRVPGIVAGGGGGQNCSFAGL